MRLSRGLLRAVLRLRLVLSLRLILCLRLVERHSAERRQILYIHPKRKSEYTYADAVEPKRYESFACIEEDIDTEHRHPGCDEQEANDMAENEHRRSHLLGGTLGTKPGDDEACCTANPLLDNKIKARKVGSAGP